MNWWMETGRFLILAGTIIIAVGLIFLLADKIPIGKLPGDIRIGGGRFKFYFPLTTSILISLILTIIINFFSRK